MHVSIPAPRHGAALRRLLIAAALVQVAGPDLPGSLAALRLP